MKIKKFDCVEMKHQAAEKIARRLQGMSRKEELSYWHSRYAKMMTQTSQKAIKQH
ncbi:MAG: hypothetical protein PHC61_15575 [Chitinivibrionales bacterium]|nr:hypothetical protein [Chitinivibrionales bacterium]